MAFIISWVENSSSGAFSRNASFFVRAHDCPFRANLALMDFVVIDFICSTYSFTFFSAFVVAGSFWTRDTFVGRKIIVFIIWAKSFTSLQGFIKLGSFWAYYFALIGDIIKGRSYRTLMALLSFFIIDCAFRAFDLTGFTWNHIDGSSWASLASVIFRVVNWAFGADSFRTSFRFLIIVGSNWAAMALMGCRIIHCSFRTFYNLAFFALQIITHSFWATVA